MQNIHKRPDFRKIPGKVSVTISAFQEGDPLGMELFDGRPVQAGIKLSEVRRQLGGDKGKWREPFRGTDMNISVENFKSLDPEKTYIKFMFSFEPDREFLRQHPEVEKELLEARGVERIPPPTTSSSTERVS